MEESFTIPPAEDSGDCELDPRIQVELEKLNAATDEINKLETELDESNTTFRLLLGEASRRLGALAKRLGACVDKSRPYYDALDSAANARAECQKAAVAYQRASELHAAAKETVTLAEKRFVSKQDEWQFDSAWQEVLNHAIIKVTDAEKRKADSGREHQKKAMIFNAAERKVTQLEDSLKRHILKSRLYFDEKKLCEEQLKTQKDKIETLQKGISNAKNRYSQSLKALEVISEEIHRRRGEYPPCKDEIPVGPREPGVGAEKEPEVTEIQPEAETASQPESDDDSNLQQLRLKVRELNLKAIDTNEVENDEQWSLELKETINKLDNLLMMKEKNQAKRSKFTSLNPSPSTSQVPEKDHWKASEPNLAIPKAEIKPIYGSMNDSMTKSNPEMFRSPLSLDVVSLARDTANLDRESYLKAIIEDKSPTGTYTESLSERAESPDDILTVECDNKHSPIIKMTNENDN